jgi:hypothetical protein
MGNWVVYNKQMADIRQRFKGDKSATELIDYVDAMVLYLESFPELPAQTEKEVMETIRIIVKECPSTDRVRPNLQGYLLWVLNSRFGHLLNVTYRALEIEHAAERQGTRRQNG